MLFNYTPTHFPQLTSRSVLSSSPDQNFRSKQKCKTKSKLQSTHKVKIPDISLDSKREREKERESIMQLKPLNTYTTTIMLFITFIILFFTGFLEFPSISSSIIPQQQQRQHQQQQQSINPSSQLPIITESKPEPFTNLLAAFKRWDSEVGCAQFRDKHKGLINNGVKTNGSGSLQEFSGDCGELKMEHVSVLVKGWTWIPDNLDNLYSCRCGISCLWTKSSVLADHPDALLFESSTPPLQVLKMMLLANS